MPGNRLAESHCVWSEHYRSNISAGKDRQLRNSDEKVSTHLAVHRLYIAPFGRHWHTLRIVRWCRCMYGCEYHNSRMQPLGIYILAAVC